MPRRPRRAGRAPAAAALALAALAASLAGCAAAAGPALTPATQPVDPNAPVVAFYGDSYTLGTGASRADNRWSSIICADRGWTEINPSVNGLGFVNNRGGLDLPAQIVAAEPTPDIVIVTMGLNDNFSFDRAGTGIRDAAARDLATLRDGLPDARLIVVEPFWYTDSRPDSVETIIGWVREEAAAVGADWIPGASHWIEGHPEWMAGDGLHPNDAGYAEMARRMDAELEALGL